MITEARIDNLLRCVRNNEEASDFKLSVYVHHCGHYGCLVGNDSIACGVDESDMSAHRLRGIRRFVAWAEREYGVRYSNRHTGLYDFLFGGFRRNDRGKEACINRLRKFIYYVAHKRELMYDDSGRIRETARRSEGDHHVLRAVKSAVERKEREFSHAE